MCLCGRPASVSVTCFLLFVVVLCPLCVSSLVLYEANDEAWVIVVGAFVSVGIFRSTDTPPLIPKYINGCRNT